MVGSVVSIASARGALVPAVAAIHPAAAGFGTGGLAKWLQENVVTLVILLLAITVLWAARGGNVSKGITTVTGLILGLAVLGIASGTNAQELADFVVGLFKA